MFWTQRPPLDDRLLLLANFVDPILLADDPGDESRPILLPGSSDQMWADREVLSQ